MKYQIEEIQRHAPQQSRIKWIKLSTSMFDDEKIKLIQQMPDGDAIIVIWVKILMMAGKSNMGGYLLLTETIPYTDHMLESLLGYAPERSRLALKTFLSLGMMEIAEDKYYVSNWAKHQSIEGMESIRERERVKKANYRAMLKEKVSTPLKDNKTKNKNKSHFPGTVPGQVQDIPLPFSSKEFMDTWGSWINHLKEKKCKTTPTAFERQKRKLKSLGEKEAIRWLDWAIEHNWQGLFEPTNNLKSKVEYKPIEYSGGEMWKPTEEDYKLPSAMETLERLRGKQ